LQPVATGRKSHRPKNGSNTRKPLPWVAMVRRGSTVRVRQRASCFLLLSRWFRCLDWRRLRVLVSTQRPPASTVAVVRRSARRAGGLHARVRRARSGRNGGRSWSGWRPCSERGRRWRCRHGARRLRRCGEDRRPSAEARSGGELCRLPLAVAEVVQVEEPPRSAGKSRLISRQKRSQFAQRILLRRSGRRGLRVTASWSPQNAALLESRSERR
jgi:hypothetical protein